MSDIYLGIDPGVNGGLAALTPEGRVHQVTKMPKGDKVVWNWIEQYRMYSSAHPVEIYAVIESIPPAVGIKNSKGKGSSKGSMSKLYGSYRALRMALVAAGIIVCDVKLGEVWRAFDIAPRRKEETQSQWKGRLKAKAQILFSKTRVTLAISDALLFAEYGRRKGEGFLVTSLQPKPSDSEVSL